MKIEEMRVTDLVPYENNPRKNDGAVDAVAASIREFGFKVPIIVDKDNVIVCGHTRLKAAEKLGMKTVPVIRADDLTEEQIRAFRLADNKTGEIAEWDFAKLEEELRALDDIDMGQFGFEDLEEKIHDYDVKEDDFDEDEVPKEEPKAKRGDVYQLGEHRLMCGDSTSAGDLKKLMGGAKADISVTSPPYGESNSAKLRDHYVRGAEKRQSLYVDHDDKIGEWYELIEKSFALMQEHSRAQYINVQMLADNKKALIEFVSKNAESLVDVIIWNKLRSAPQMQANILNNQFEFVFVFCKENSSRSIPFGRFHGNESNVIDIATGRNEFADIHRAVFPVQLPAKLIQLSSGCGSVLDPFGGTGTTMMACEQMRRRSYTMELDPHYVDVIIARWEAFTGKKAEKIN